jgi:hypothetical protein
MKKLNRVLSLIIVLALAISVFALPASAINEDETQKQTSGEQAGGTEGSDTTETKVITSLPVTKDLVTENKDTALPTTEFYVEMVPATTAEIAGAKAGDVTIESGLALASPIASFSFSAEDDKDMSPVLKDGEPTGEGEVEKSSSFAFSFVDGEGKAATFSHTGVYRYYVKEVIKQLKSGSETEYEYVVPTQEEGKQYYITYDKTVYVVDLYVGTVDGAMSVIGMGITKQGEEAKTDAAKPDAVSFTNTINCGSIKISKSITKDTTEYIPGMEYQFYILIPEAGDSITLMDNDVINAQKYNSDGTKDGEEFELKVKGATIDADIVENGTAFTLKAGQYIEVTAPLGMIFKVAEVVPTAEGYTIAIDYKESGTFSNSQTLNTVTADRVETIKEYEGTDPTGQYTGESKLTGKAIKGTVNTNTTRVEFINQLEMATATGVNLDFVPYAIIALMAVIGCAVLIVKKSRKVH